MCNVLCESVGCRVLGVDGQHAAWAGGKRQAGSGQEY